MKVGTALGMLLLIAAFGIDCASHSRLKPPRVASQTPLDYPLSAQLDRLEGEVSLTVFVTPDGRPEEVALSRSSGHEVLDEAALRFVKKLNFTPGTLDEEPVGSWTRLVLRYKLSEQAFERDRWLADILELQKQIAAERDTTLREVLLRRLYTHYIGCVTYVDSNEDPAINSLIRDVISKKQDEHWRPFWNQYAAPFVLFDDFLANYPDTEIAGQARQDLVRYIMDMETKIRIRSLKSRRVAQSADGLMELLEERLKALQTELQGEVQLLPAAPR